MKTLIVLYSKTGNTAIIGGMIAKETGGVLEKIADKKNRKGFLGFINSCKESLLKVCTQIEQTKYKPEDFDLIFIGTPVWAHNMVPAIRTYIEKNFLDTGKQNLSRKKKFAVFCTTDTTGIKSTLDSMGELLLDENVIAKIGFSAKELKDLRALDSNVSKWVESVVKGVAK